MTEYSDRYYDLELVVTDDYEALYGFSLFGIRKETERERKNRLQRTKNARKAAKASAKKRREEKEANERKLYEKLKKKFETGVYK